MLAALCLLARLRKRVCSGCSAVAGTLVESGSCSGLLTNTGWLVEMGKKTVSSRASLDHDNWEVAAAAGKLDLFNHYLFNTPQFLPTLFTFPCICTYIPVHTILYFVFLKYIFSFFNLFFAYCVFY